ncbi:MAG: OmpA family protein [Paucibacter sp.]|nr:OmpA family protein [Roseateles sp.]
MRLLICGWAAALLAGCAAPERVVLLPQADGRPSAVIVHSQGPGGAQGLILAQPYAEAQLDSGKLELVQNDAASVLRDFGTLIDFQPRRPRLFTVNFRPSSDTLTPETENVLDEVIQALAAMPAGELIVIGHTSRVGSVQDKDRLSLQRAAVVAELLVRRGVPSEKIERVGRGERELLVPTDDQVDEPRNHRVEIKLR